MGKFSADVTKWGNKALEEFNELRKAVVLELFSSVILDTPVAEGRLRGNWQVASTVLKGELKVIDPDGRETIIKVEDHLKGEKLTEDNVTYLTNNLPYAYRIEYDGWSHTKAPEGMVRKNFVRVSNNLRRATT